MHAIRQRYVSNAASRTAKHRCKLSDDTHMNGVRSSQNVLDPCLCVLPSTKSQAKTQEGPQADPPHRQESRGQAENFSSHGLFTRLHARTHTQPHTLVHRHSHTVSSISAASQQQVSEDRGHLCARLPFFSSASGHLCWEKTGREGQATDSVSDSLSTPPPKHKISLIKMHEHWHHERHLSIPPFLPVPCDYLFPNICSLATASLSPSTASPLPLCLLAPVSIMHPMLTHTHKLFRPLPRMQPTNPDHPLHAAANTLSGLFQ